MRSRNLWRNLWRDNRDDVEELGMAIVTVSIIVGLWAWNPLAAIGAFIIVAIWAWRQ
jgi:hypothetical protein